jgi:restriction system protein
MSDAWMRWMIRCGRMMAASSRRQCTRRRPMKRRKNSSSTAAWWVGLFLVLMICGGTAEADPWAIRFAGAVVIVAIAVAVFVVIIALSTNDEATKLRSISLDNVDNMQGVEFENYVKALLAHRGFAVETTKASGDLGVDLVARRRDESVAIQVKRQRGPVSRHAVSDAVGGMAHYACRAAMVVTNSHFSQGAKELAHSNCCLLVDREVLTQWIMDFQGAGGKFGG